MEGEVVDSAKPELFSCFFTHQVGKSANELVLLDKLIVLPW